MKIINFISSEKAVSEVVDFVTILGILVLSIGLIAVAGYPMLKNAQEAKHIENTKQSFIVLADNINKVVLGYTPSQSVELKMYGGMLSLTGNNTINITAENPAAQRITLVDRQMRSIESVVGNTVIAYEGTGVWAKYPNGNTIVVYKPLITNHSNVLIIPVVTIVGTSSTGGSGMSRVTAKGAPRVTFYGNVSNITVTITGNYISGWKDYFDNIMRWSYTMGDTITARLNTTNLDVYILEIQLDTEVE